MRQKRYMTLIWMIMAINKLENLIVMLDFFFKYEEEYIQ